MGVIAPLLPVKIDFDITRLETVGVLRFVIVGFLRLKALGGGVALNEGAIDAKVLAAQTRRQGLVHHGGKKTPRQIMVVESLTIMRERSGVERLFARLQIEEPTEEQIGVNPFAKLAFAAHLIEGHK